MTGKELLKQYNDLLEEIKEIEKRVDKLNNQKSKIVSDTVVGSDVEFPYAERTYNISGVAYTDFSEKVDRLNKLLILRKRRCEELKLQIEEFINTIPDSRTRRVFSLRYIDGMTWLQIARRIERYDESYPRKVIHDKYLDNF